jgi:hypothetical protein
MKLFRLSLFAAVTLRHVSVSRPSKARPIGLQS